MSGQKPRLIPGHAKVRPAFVPVRIRASNDVDRFLLLDYLLLQSLCHATCIEYTPDRVKQRI